jgi:hypothetical protein
MQPNNNKLTWTFSADATGEAKEWAGIDNGTIHVYGTFGSGTISLEGSTDGGTTWTAYSTTYTAATITTFEAGNILIRAKLAGATNPSLTVDIVPQERP